MTTTRKIVVVNSTVTLCMFYIAVLLFGGCAQNSTTTSSVTASDLNILDSNGDGIINPYEALDALLVLEKENGKALSIKDLNKLALKKKKEHEEEMTHMLSRFDKNKDGKIVLKEIDEDALGFAQRFDSNQDGTITISEMMEFDFAGSMLSNEDEIQSRIKNLFKELDTNKDNFIDISTEVDEDRLGRIFELDLNRDQKVTKKEAYNFMKADNTPVEFTVNGNTAYMTGIITAGLPAVVLQLLFEHPNVKTIEMLIVPGSIDDVANIRAALYINQHGLTTKLNARSIVASGGTDFFVAGKNRIVEKGAIIGVHSWGGGPVAAADVPRDDPVHQKYIDYYNSVGIPEAFYWYTLEAAPARNMHIMTEEEIKIYKVRTTLEMQ